MANKTVIVRSKLLEGKIGLILYIGELETGDYVNEDGFELSELNNGAFQCTIPDAVTGWFFVDVFDGATAFLENGMLYILSDIPGIYIVNDPRNLQFTDADRTLLNDTADYVQNMITAFESNGAGGLRLTEEALVFSGKSPIFLEPTAFNNTEQRDQGPTLYVYNNETWTWSPVIVDAEGEPVDLTGITLDFIIEDQTRTTLGSTLGIAGALGTQAITIPSMAPVVVNTTKYFSWSLREAATGRVIKAGPVVFRYAPIKP